MTYLEIVNKVMVRLRENTVTSVNQNVQSALVGEFVSEAISKVEDAWDWNALLNTIQVATDATVFQYVLTGAGKSFNVKHVHEDTEDYDLTLAESHEWMTHQLLQNTPTSDMPTMYDFNGVDTAGDPVVTLYPIPDAVYNVNFNMKIKTNTEAITDSTEITVPVMPIILFAWYYAIEERGDNTETDLTRKLGRAESALADAVVYDAANAAPQDTEWEVE